MVALYPPGGYTTYTNQQLVDIIKDAANQFQVPFELAAAIVWQESTFNPNQGGDWVWDGTLTPAPAGSHGAHPRSIGLFQLNREGGLGTGHSPLELLDPNLNVQIGVGNLAQSSHGASMGEWAYNSQHPADREGYIHAINELLHTRPWENLTNNDIANPPPPDYGDPGTGGIFPGVVWPFPDFPINIPPLPWPLPGWPGGGGGGGGGGTDPGTPPGGTTGSGLPDLITADPVVLGHVPGYGDLTVNMTPILNWGLRIGVTIVAVGLIGVGLYVLAKPLEEEASKQAEKAATVAAKVGA